MRGEVDVREREAADMAQAESALRSVHKTDGYPVEGVRQAAAWLKPSGLIRAWVAEFRGDIVGHCLVASPDGEEAAEMWREQSGEEFERIAVLGRLFVIREARSISAGRALVQAAQDWASRQGLTLVLDVMEKDTAAMRLYERLGWRRIGEAVHEFGEGQQTRAACYVAPTGGRQLC